MSQNYSAHLAHRKCTVDEMRCYLDSVIGKLVYIVFYDLHGYGLVIGHSLDGSDALETHAAQVWSKAGVLLTKYDCSVRILTYTGEILTGLRFPDIETLDNPSFFTFVDTPD
jgi:hypothetical protein